MLEKLKKKFEVVEVVIDDSFSNITKVKTAYNMIDKEYGEYDGYYMSEPDLESLADKTYRVDYVSLSVQL